MEQSDGLSMTPDAPAAIYLVGAAVIDVLVRPAGEEIFRTGSCPVEQIHMSPGGDAMNEAAVLAALGRRVELCTVIGTDTAGEVIEARCRRLGIRLDPRCKREEMCTGINVVLVQENGERSFFTNPKSSLRRLTLNDIPVPYPGGYGILCFASIFVFPEIGPAELEILFRQAKRQGMLVCADMTKRKKGEFLADLAPALSYVDYLFPNEEEACLLTGAGNANGAAELLYEAGVRNVIIKCGARGCLIRNRTLCEMVPAVRQEVCVDTTGAGDSFAAGFLYALSEGRGLRECAEYANRCGARAVACMGAADWAVHG